MIGRNLLCACLVLLTACGDDTMGTAEVDGGVEPTEDSGVDAGGIDAAQPTCDAGQPLDGECVTERLDISLVLYGEILTSVTSVMGLATSQGTSQGEGTTINERCTLYSGDGFFTPDPFECPELGPMFLSNGIDEIELSAAERCYSAQPNKPWAGDEVTVTWEGSSDYPAGSVTSLLPVAPIIEVDSTEDGSFTVTRTNADEAPNWNLSLVSNTENVVCDATGTDSIEFSAAEVESLQMREGSFGLIAGVDTPRVSAATDDLEVRVYGVALSNVENVFETVP